MTPNNCENDEYFEKNYELSDRVFQLFKVFLTLGVFKIFSVFFNGNHTSDVFVHKAIFLHSAFYFLLCSISSICTSCSGVLTPRISSLKSRL